MKGCGQCPKNNEKTYNMPQSELGKKVMVLGHFVCIEVFIWVQKNLLAQCSSMHKLAKKKSTSNETSKSNLHKIILTQPSPPFPLFTNTSVFKSKIKHLDRDD